MTRLTTWVVATIAITGALSAGAQLMEHGLRLDPCPLCLMQRIWVMIAGLVALAALADRPERGVYPLLTLVAALIGGGFAVRQLYLQQLPPEAVPACGPDLAYMLEAFPLRDVLTAMTVGTGNCAEIDRVLGVNIAIWSLLGFIAIATCTLLWWRSIHRPA
jgi:disulfide bond formation protein DsbB